MKASDIQAAASLLLTARREAAPLAADRLARLPIASRADAYAIQERVAAELGPVGAWKVGASSPEAEPARAPIQAAAIHVSPAVLPAAAFHRIGIEVEIAYRLGCDLPARQAPYGRAEVEAAIEAVLPAIEVVDTRLADHEAMGALWKLADNQLNGGLVLGAPRADWRAVDPATQPVRLRVDGALVHEGRGGNAAGDPIRLLVWLANACGSHCGGLRRGQVVTTGTLTGLRFVGSGAEIHAALPGLGEVAVSFPG
ncbi:MAG: fumarylacetoacetate hydrolase family protein [Acetobacteraceae bacterium]|nr:fumarylacetoacetate hydrolase family protein [Acetobacteraceae bacterium]